MGSTRLRAHADPLSEELSWFFQEGDADVGVTSSFGAFVQMIQTGIPGHGGRANTTEARAVEMTDRRVVGDHRRVRAQLAAVEAQDPRLTAALYAAYGGVDWGRVADVAGGRGTGTKLARALGPNRIGVAMLTEALRPSGHPRTVYDGWNRWDFAAMSEDGEPLYRCAGPTMEVVETWEPETDDKLRRRAIAYVGGPDTEAGKKLAILSGQELEEGALQQWMFLYRRFTSSRRIVATGKAAREPEATAPGAKLAALAVAAFPVEKAKKRAAKARSAEALAKLTAVRDEAAMLLERARLAYAKAGQELDTVERREAPKAEPKRHRGARVARRVDPGVRGPSRPREAWALAPELASEALLA